MTFLAAAGPVLIAALAAFLVARAVHSHLPAPAPVRALRRVTEEREEEPDAARDLARAFMPLARLLPADPALPAARQEPLDMRADDRQDQRHQHGNRQKDQRLVAVGLPPLIPKERPERPPHLPPPIQTGCLWDAIYHTKGMSRHRTRAA